ncbi:MAG: glycosyltransferase [Aquificaceae bacterium]|nr:glycosyltransferase [Aquificaceae bacterium]
MDALGERNVYFLINSLAGGGAERVVVNLSKFLPIRKIFLLERDVQYETNLPLEFISNHNKEKNPILKTLFIPLYVKSLANAINTGDLVVSFLERSNFVNVLSKTLRPHKAVISVRTTEDEFRGLKSINKQLMKFFYPKADLVIAVSKGVAQYLEEKYKVPKDKLAIIYNPVDVEKIQALVKEPTEIDFNPYIITVGRLTEAKGQWFLLKVFKEVKKMFPELKLLIFGDGELNSYLVNFSESIGLKTYLWNRDRLMLDYDVYFMGFSKNPFKYISKAQAFLLTSLWEGFPNALIEALACGVCVISSDCKSGPREILAPDTDFRFQTREPEFAKYGILMPVFEEDNQEIVRAWVETIKRVLTDEGLRERYSKVGPKRAEDFRIEKIVDEWRRILSAIR